MLKEKAKKWVLTTHARSRCLRSHVEGCGSYTGKRVQHVCLKILPMLTQFERHSYTRWDRCPVDHNDGQFLTTMKWSTVFVTVPLESMVFNSFFYSRTIVVDGFSMVLSYSNHRSQWIFNGFLTIEPLPSNEWFCSSPLTWMVFNGSRQNMICYKNRGKYSSDIPTYDIPMQYNYILGIISAQWKHIHWKIQVTLDHTSYLSPIPPIYLWRKKLSCGEISDFYAWQMWRFLKFLHM